MKTPGLGSKRLFLDLYLSPKNDWLELFPERLCNIMNITIDKCTSPYGIHKKNGGLSARAAALGDCRRQLVSNGE